MRPILAIDPGPEQSAWLLLGEDGMPVTFRKEPNADVLMRLRSDLGTEPILVLEEIRSYGQAVGQSVFETCFWSGRFAEAWQSRGGEFTRIGRKDVVLHLCGTSRAKDSNVRQALLDRFGGKEKAIGTKKAGYGPLHGISKDVWSALAIALTYADCLEQVAKHK